jgi:hypothetical protein
MNGTRFQWKNILALIVRVCWNDSIKLRYLFFYLSSLFQCKAKLNSWVIFRKLQFNSYIVEQSPSHIKKSLGSGSMLKTFRIFIVCKKPRGKHKKACHRLNLEHILLEIVYFFVEIKCCGATSWFYTAPAQP